MELVPDFVLDQQRHPLAREIRRQCVELRLSDFFPRQDWQQAGLLIVQAITSLGRDFSKPEEIVHQRLFVVEPRTEDVVRENLASSALRIEKRGTRFRLLYAAGSMKNAAFKEVGTTDFDLRPAYLAVFALKGFVGQADDMPVLVDAFSVSASSCSP